MPNIGMSHKQDLQTPELKDLGRSTTSSGNDTTVPDGAKLH